MREHYKIAIEHRKTFTFLISPQTLNFVSDRDMKTRPGKLKIQHRNFFYLTKWE